MGDQAATAAYPSLAAPALVDGANLPLVSGSGGRSDRELLLRPICKGSGSSNLRERERERERAVVVLWEREMEANRSAGKAEGSIFDSIWLPGAFA